MFYFVVCGGVIVLGTYSHVEAIAAANEAGTEEQPAVVYQTTANPVHWFPEPKAPTSKR